MIDGGCDPLYVARRVVRMASEDIGNADPRALELSLNAWQVQERLGSPEGELAIAQAITYLAVAAKSNAVYSGYGRALSDAAELPGYEVPLHIRNAPTALMKEMGHGDDYRYAHNFDDGFVAGESYMPQELDDKTYYEPVNRGLELKISEKQVISVLNLLEEGNTVPFIARYRKEATGSLDEDQIRVVEKEYTYQAGLAKRKEEVIRLIDERGMLTPDLEKDINAAIKLQQVEDIYLPFKEKRKTKATEAELKEMWLQLEQNNGRKIIHFLSNYINERYYFWHRWIGALKETNIKTKIIWAKNDPVAVAAIADLLATEIANNNLYWIKNCGHFPMLEKPEEWIEKILSD